ncbi:MAG: oligosaccharide flippase family protein [Candidatus Omnitrophica bacterium]|nr:oligosaccharide flippase family protein [Candidatus Omnitrophota bacterium]
MSKRKEILQNAFVYFSGTFLTQGITLVASVLSRRFLGPVQTGIWSTLQVLVDYSKYSTLGLMEAATRDIPYFIGKQNRKKADEIKDLSFSFILATSLITAAGIFVFTLFVKGRLSPEVATGLFLVAFLIVLQRINNFLISILRTHKQFSIEARQMVFSAAVNAFLVMTLAYFFKIYGFLLAMVFSFIFNIVYLLMQYRFRFHWKLDLSKIFPLIQFGFPLMFLALLNTILRSLDRIVIAKFMGFQAMGFYSIALMICSYMSNFYSATNAVLSPYFLEKFSVKDNPEDLQNYMVRSSLAYVMMMSAMIGLAWIAVPYAIALFLPKFIDGLSAMKILTFAMFFIAMIQTYQDFLITIKKHKVLFPFLGLICGIAAGLNYVVVHYRWGISGVAWVTLIVAFLQFSGAYFLASHHLRDRAGMAKRYFILLGTAIYLFGMLKLIHCWIPSNMHSLKTAFLQLLVFIAVFSPAWIWFEREYSIFSLIRKKIFKTSDVSVPTAS